MQRPLMHRHNNRPKQCDDGEINILTRFERFAFSILPCELEVARDAIRNQGAQWLKNFVVDEACDRDAQIIYRSPDGPNWLPAIEIGILLNEVSGRQGKRTLFISNTEDGYRSMILCISKIIPGTHLMFRVSRVDLQYPGNFLEAAEGGEFVRTVYAMRDSDRWVFFEKGDPLPFENLDQYLAQRKRDRLTPEIISTYLKRIGYGSLRQEFWLDKTAAAHALATRDFRLWRPES